MNDYYFTVEDMEREIEKRKKRKKQEQEEEEEEQEDEKKSSRCPYPRGSCICDCPFDCDYCTLKFRCGNCDKILNRHEFAGWIRMDKIEEDNRK